ncbi:MAG: glutamine--tRNA ligase/YqeY domain fusion protein [Bacteroidetes bacterium]|nr:MAG: glutamine--tRNA ligase/YqeY domain fusion protein [Bacteroidota bacterium]
MNRNDEHSADTPEATSRHFIQQIIDNDLKEGRVQGEIVFRFPPEPNGFLHIGHAVRPIWVNFELAKEYRGRCHLRFDDTNPETEDMAYVDAIEEDIRWLGYDWGEHRYFASDYFEELYELALRLIDDGNAYVDSLSEEEIREYRGTVTVAGRNSPHRDRSVEENRELFTKMRAGDFPDGSHVLRAKIDMSSNNMLMRDPVFYRIKHAAHYRRGNDFPIYPLYDFAHPLSDAIENITHSLCSLEFEVHRPLYDWLVDALFDSPRPHQYEFARFNLDYTVLSKRKLLQLVEGGLVSGWDDPRMPTIAGFRRRGVTAEAIRKFSATIGIAKSDTRVDLSMLEFAIRDDLNTRAPRVMCVLRPLKIVLTNFPEANETEWIDAPYWPHDIPKEGSRSVPLTREIYIERDDFMEEPSKNFHRLSPGEEVRLRYGYIIRCDVVIRDEEGKILELRCTYDPETKSGVGSSSRRVKGTVHWVSASEGIPIHVRLYDRLFMVADPDGADDDKTFIDYLNPNSLQEPHSSIVEPSVSSVEPGDRFQFERQGYFYVDPVDSTPDHPIFNQTIPLKDTWQKAKKAASVPGLESAPGREARPETGSASAPESSPGSVSAGKRNPLEGLSDEAVSRAEAMSERHDLSLGDAALLGADDGWAEYFEQAAKAGHGGAVANWLIQEMRPVIGDGDPADSTVSPSQVAALVNLLAKKTISSRIAKDVFAEMLESGLDPEVVIEKLDLSQISDPGAIEELVDAVLIEHPDRVEAYRAGKTGLIGFFVGQLMSRTNGKVNPQLVREILEKRLSENGS